MHFKLKLHNKSCISFRIICSEEVRHKIKQNTIFKKHIKTKLYISTDLSVYLLSRYKYRDGMQDGLERHISNT